MFLEHTLGSTIQSVTFVSPQRPLYVTRQPQTEAASLSAACRRMEALPTCAGRPLAIQWEHELGITDKLCDRGLIFSQAVPVDAKAQQRKWNLAQVRELQKWTATLHTRLPPQTSDIGAILFIIARWAFITVQPICTTGAPTSGLSIVEAWPPPGTGGRLTGGPGWAVLAPPPAWRCRMRTTNNQQPTTSTAA
ncbi:uncharacterized protein B0I36DRAFT_416083 [Microdochium trichocladiopsis]|uniref:Uncharacterized protein n=1 Tax=Microdochium trichocladiopsis TaxID=1682393 RepID=A0A9P8XXX6_9PEZI|nr:uncharacterized protein B0I36DRAFT_416083 [Microdochium trichocladiopsis]KAH7024604.1 hypothetical protein B0I36DRAFT_416083 [Microdochium trichocladiopsis]